VDKSVTKFYLEATRHIFPYPSHLVMGWTPMVNMYIYCRLQFTFSL